VTKTEYRKDRQGQRQVGFAKIPPLPSAPSKPISVYQHFLLLRYFALFAAFCSNPMNFRLRRIRRCLHVRVALLATVIGMTLPIAAAADPPSWIFRKSQYSHDPHTGARVAQYSRIPPVEPLPDPRLVTSGYRRTRTNLRGPDGSVDSYYSVSSYGNGRGGLDAEWERFHDAWLQSFTAGGYYFNQYPHGQPYAAYPPYAYGHPGYAAPGFGFPPYAPPPQVPLGY
jgi:hypothetical protein